MCELVEEEVKINKNKDYLFSENIRGFLGKKRKANSKMIETLEDVDNSFYFPLYNNGLTIVCDRITIPRLSNNLYFKRLLGI